MGKLAAITSAIGTAGEVAKTFFGNKEKRDEYRHIEQAALHESFGKEFSYAATNRSWFDATMDGINRLPRPVITFAVLWLFVIAVRDPAYFTEIMIAMQKVPEMLWWLVLTIVAFFFGGRMIDKIKLPKVQNLVVRTPSRTDEVEFERETAHVSDTGNASVDDWKKKVLGQ